MPSSSRPTPRPGSGARYTAPGQQPEEPTRQRPTAVKLVAALVVAAMLLAPLAFLFTL